MKKRVPIDDLSLHDVPEELDRKILLTAAFRARRQQQRRQFRRIAAAAAAVLFVSGSAFLGYRAHSVRMPEEPEPQLLSQSELLRLGDWSELEQENYNLGLQIDSGRQAFAELAVNHL